MFSPHLAIFTLERENGPYRQLDLACTLSADRPLARSNGEPCKRSQPGSAKTCSPVTRRAAHRCKPPTPHFLPLGFVGHPHADGRLSGVALALPESASGECVPKCSVLPRGCCKKG